MMEWNEGVKVRVRRRERKREGKKKKTVAQIRQRAGVKKNFASDVFVCVQSASDSIVFLSLAPERYYY